MPWRTDLGMDVLVEVHDERELAMALASAATIIGINNRNLSTFETSLETTRVLAAEIPEGRTIVSESGIRTVDDMRLVAEWAQQLCLWEKPWQALLTPAPPYAHLRARGE